MPDDLNPKIAAKSLAITSGIVYLICALLVTIAPRITLNIFSYMFHGIDLTKIAMMPTLGLETILGLIEIIIVTYFIGWLFAKIYNYFLNI